MLTRTQKMIVNLPLLSLSGRQLDKALVHWRKKVEKVKFKVPTSFFKKKSFKYYNIFESWHTQALVNIRCLSLY